MVVLGGAAVSNERGNPVCIQLYRERMTALYVLLRRRLDGVAYMAALLVLQPLLAQKVTQYKVTNWTLRCGP